MNKKGYLFALTALFLSAYVFSPEASAKQFEGSGEVTSSDSIYSRVTIKHKPIPGFVSGGETEFVVDSQALLKNINRHDLVDFTFEDNFGDALITKIVKTGVAELEDNSLPVGRAVQDVLVGTGEAARAVTSPIPGVGQVISGATNATTDTTEPLLEDAKPEVKQAF